MSNEKSECLKDLGYLHALRITLGDLFTSCKSHPENMPRYSLIDVPEERSMGLLIGTVTPINWSKFEMRLGLFGIQLLKKQTYAIIGRKKTIDVDRMLDKYSPYTMRRFHESLRLERIREKLRDEESNKVHIFTISIVEEQDLESTTV